MSAALRLISRICFCQTLFAFLVTSHLFRPEQHRPSRCDPVKGWYPEVAGGQEQYPRATGQIAI
ncbi:hypothetical protein T02_1605 [Trichinella nativa]|uniref:Secreted protein n=1 Tax=Trichinella nativa TaxID=6335 RepID=A0A0V1LR57_9BILA|nr:hypothetical protein T02_1605 [Trichinella nativa]